ncbi:MAG: hypothetical protein Q9191_003635 [Dirinaria sp. TL-2023a]
MLRLWSIKSEETGSPNLRPVLQIPRVSNPTVSHDTSDSDTELSDEMFELRNNHLARHEVIKWMNASIDKSAALLNHNDDSKVKIPLRNFYGSEFGTGANQIYDGCNDHPNPLDLILVYPLRVEFSSSESVRALNRWRNTIFKHYLGTGLEFVQQEWSSTENEYLLQAYAKLKAQRLGLSLKARQKLRSWAGITRDFNVKFEGRIFPGEEKPRPPRSEEELRQQWNRICPEKMQVKCDRMLQRTRTVEESRAHIKAFGKPNMLLLSSRLKHQIPSTPTFRFVHRRE